MPSIFTSLTRIANASDTLKIALNEISYKPFISFFNVTEASATDPSLAGIGGPFPACFRSSYTSDSPAVDYASVVALEVHAGDGNLGPTVNARFKNGTTDASLHDIALFGERSVPLSRFISTLAVSIRGLFSPESVRWSRS